MASSGGKIVSEAAHRLHLVTQVRSGIRKPWWQKRTLKALRLGRVHRNTLVKNVPANNGQLLSIKNLVKIQPIIVKEEEMDGLLAVEDSKILSSMGKFVKDDGKLDVEAFHQFVKEYPKTVGAQADFTIIAIERYTDSHTVTDTS